MKKSAFKAMVARLITHYESGFECGAEGVLYWEKPRFQLPMCQSSAELFSSAPPKMSHARAMDVMQLKNWIDDETLDDVAFRQCLVQQVTNVMQSGVTLPFFNVHIDPFPDGLIKGLRDLLAERAFSLDNLRLMQQYRAHLNVNGPVVLDDVSLRQSVLLEREAEITRQALEIRLLRERNHQLFLINRQLSQALGRPPVADTWGEEEVPTDEPNEKNERPGNGL